MVGVERGGRRVDRLPLASGRRGRPRWPRARPSTGGRGWRRSAPPGRIGARPRPPRSGSRQRLPGPRAIENNAGIVSSLPPDVLERPARLLAGPGAGKTQALVDLYADLVEGGRAGREQILVLTF